MDQEGWHLFLELCLKMSSRKQLGALFHALFTPEECSLVAKRCLIIRELLKREKTQREIARDLEVSIAKITRGSNALKGIEKKLKQFLKKNV